jgi:PAS domain S-box-containing protein
VSEAKLRQFLRDAREQIIARFVADLARRDPKAGLLSPSLLLDHLPGFFDEVLFELDASFGSLPDHKLPTARVHARERWRSGFDVRQVVREYGVLRHAIFDELQIQQVALTPAELEPLLNCLNAGIAEAVVAFADESDSVRHTLDEKELALAANELRLTLVTESIPQIVWTARADGQTDWLNGRWREYTGVDPAHSLGSGWVAAYHPEDQAASLSRWQHSTRSLLPFEIESRLRRHDGVYRWFLVRAIPVRDGSGNITRWFGTCTDIDDQKQTQTRLIAATEESARLNRLKDEFLATVSHELRTPLQSILGWARLLKAGHLTAERAEAALDTIERNAKAQSQLIEDILDVSRIITGKARFRAEPVDLKAVLSSALETTQPAARAKGILLRSELPADLGTLTGDGDRLQQVVWNLLSNAVKFTPAGGFVRISAERSEHLVSIEVEDEGVGIDPSFLPYVFDRFRQADAGSARAHGGLGIGLAIVRHIVEMHGGTVSVASRGVGQGALFTVQLPTESPAVTPIPPTAAPLDSEPKLPALDTLSGVSVLVVDDQADARDLMVAILLQHGAQVHGAASVEEAIGLLGRERVQVLVSDIAMPHEDGHALIHKVRGTDALRQLPAIALTAYAHEHDRRRALEAGYHLHLAKPVEPAHLVLAIVGLLREHAAASNDND